MNLGTLTAILAVVDKISPAVSGIGGNVSKAMAGIKASVVAGFSVAAITGFIGKFNELTGRLTDLSARTGIGTEALQAIDLHFKAAGVSIDTVTNAIGEMGRRLVGGDSGAVNALAQLGLKASDLVKLQPDAAFTRIADAVAGIQNPMERATAAQEIFGKGGKELLAGLNGTLAASRAEYERLGLVLSDDVVAAGDEFGDVLGVLQTAGMAFLAQVLKPLLPALTQLAQWLGSLAAGAIPALQGAFQSLIAKGLQVELWLRELVLRVTELGAKVPWLGEKLGASAETLAQLRERVQAAKDAIAAYAVETGKAEAPVRTVAAVVGVYGDNARQAGEDLKALEARQEAVNKVLREARWPDLAFQNLRAALKATNEEIGAHLEGLAETRDVIQIGILPATADWQAKLVALKPALEDAKVGAKGLGDVLQHNLLGVLQSIPGTIASAFTGGGGLGGALKAVASQVGSVFGGTLGAAIGGPLGQSIGSAIGSLAGPVAGFLGNLFGKSSGKAANNLRDQIVATAGGIQELARRAVEAGTSVDALLRARNPEQVKAAWDALNSALNSHQQQLDLARQAMQEFGIDASQAGAAFKQAEMDETARSITEKLEAMMAVGVSTDAIIAGAGDEIAAFIQRSIEMGTTVPKEWEPIVRKMMEAGQLVVKDSDAIAAATDRKTELERQYAEAMKDTSDAGRAKQAQLKAAIAEANAEIEAGTTAYTDMGQVPFAETLNDKIGKVMDKLLLFIDRILDVPDALSRIPREVTIDFEGRKTGDWPEGGVPAMGAGGIVTRPTLALIGERGPEAVVPLTRAGGPAAAVGGGPTVHVHVDARGALFPDYAGQQRLADLLSEAVMRDVMLRTRVGFAGMPS